MRIKISILDDSDIEMDCISHKISTWSDMKYDLYAILNSLFLLLRRNLGNLPNDMRDQLNKIKLIDDEPEKSPF